MIIIQAYKGKHQITDSQRKTLLDTANRLKRLGYAYMFVDVTTPVFSDTAVLEYVAVQINEDGSEWTERAFVGKRGALSNGIGRNNKAGASLNRGNSLEYTIPHLDKFEHVITV
jgi:hypothetical protein